MRVFRRGICLTSGLAGLLLGAGLASAQQPANLEQGLKAYGSYHGGDLDTVSLTSGNLMLNIPLISYPQRGGKLSFGFHLKYNNKGWQQVVVPANSGSNPEWVWKGAGVEVALDQDLIEQATILQENDGNNQQTIRIPIWNVITPDGSSHEMEYTSGTGAPDSSAPKESVDTTGIQSGSGSGSQGLIDRNGVLYGATQIQDPNGNSIAYSASSPTGWTDTLGRVISGVFATSEISDGTYGEYPSIGAIFPGGVSSDLSKCPTDSSAARVWSLPGPNGGTFPMTFCYEKVSLQSQFNLAGWTDEPAADEFLNAVILPNGSSWQFSYNSWGDLTQVTFPTGGSLSYTWMTVSSCDGYAPESDRAVATRTLNANDGTSGTWQYQWQVATNGSNTTTIVTDPLGNDTTHNVSDLGGCALYVTQDQYFQGAYNAQSPVVVKTKATTYSEIQSPRNIYVSPSPAIDVVPTSITTTWANGNTTQEIPTYDSGNTFVFDDLFGGQNPYCGPCLLIYGNVVQNTKSDFGANGTPGSVLRTTMTQYQWMNNSAYLTNNLLDLKASVQVLDGGGTQRSYSTYGYDESALIAPSPAITEQWAAGESNPGNLTSVHRWLSNGSAVAQTPCNAAVASGGYLVTTNVYFNTGELQQSTDPCLYSTTYLYSASYFGAYPTTVTNPLGQQTTSGYDFNTGLVTSVTDPNSKTTTKTYDIMDRLTGISYPDGGSTGYCYTDMGGSTCTISQAPPYQAVVTDAITSSLNETATILFDGLGRPTQTQLNSDPDGTTYTLTTYDALGRKSKVYNPTRCSTPTSNCKNETTWGYTTTKYDVLNRVTSVVEQDGSTVGTNYAAYPCTTVTDEVGTSRQSCLDGLGRMTSVVEDPGSSPHLNYQTSYLYDVLGNMTSVTQNGSNSANARNRSFLYDSLSRLTSATNPESGTITYAYDADGNVITKTAPKPNQTTGTATVTTTDTYDQLNRLVEKAFVGITTPALQYGYDGTSLSGCGQAPPSIASPTNLIGRRSSMCSGMSASSWSYDPMGRPLLESRTNVTPADELCTGAGKYRVCSKYSYAIPLNVGYLYNLDGSLSTLTYPSGDQVTYTPGGAGRSLGLSDSANSFVANGTANHATYAPNGALATMANGYTSTPVFAGIVTSNFYNDRLQPISLSASAGGNAVSSFCFDFHLGVQVQATGDCSAITAYTTGDNGNLFQITNNVATNNVNSLGTAVFAYDSLNRIKQAKTVSTSSNCWGEAYTIDAWGNLTGRTNIGATGCVSEGSLSYAVNTSNQYTQLSGVTYDIAGNVLDDGNGNKPTYDAENTMATDAGVTYDYDADGVRIEKSSGTLYWTGSGGEYLTETDLTGTINEEYIYFNGERIARVDRPSGTVHYYYSDHLGSSSVIADASGNIEQQYVYFPYGGMVDSTGTDPNHYKFTGKERDTESGLDEFGARYYASSLGRFLIPDWADKPIAVPYAHFGNPQSLNLYSYVQNNPTTFGDPDGHENEGPPVNSSGAGAWPVRRCSLCPIPDSAQVTDANLAVQNASLANLAAQNTSWIQKLKNFFTSDPCGSNQNCVTVYATSGTVGKAWLTAMSPIQKAADWGDRHPLVIFPIAIAAAFRGDEGPIEADELTAEEYISKYLKGGINSVFPGQFKDSTIKAIQAAAKSGDQAARTALKLLTDGRFKK